MKSPAFVRFYGNDWFTGCAGLKADERGVYISMCVYIWTVGQRVPLNDAEAARLLCLNFKTYQRVRDRLVVLGKVKKYETGYGNERAERELQCAGKGVQGRPDEIAGSGNIGGGEKADSGVRQTPCEAPKADATVLVDRPIDHVIDDGIDRPIDRQKSKQFLRANKELELSKERIQQQPTELVTARDGAAVPPPAVEVLEKKLLAACNGSLADPVNASGLLSMAVPLMWIDQGCDLERDVIPTLTALGKRYHGRNISTWDYFTRPITEAKVRRERGLPTVNVTGQSRPRTLSRFGAGA